MELKFYPNYKKVLISEVFNFLIIIIFFFILFQVVTLFFEISAFNIILLALGFLLFLFLLNLFFKVGRIKNSTYHIKDDFLLRKTKFVSISEDFIPFSQVTNVNYTISWFWDKIFRTGTIRIYTSGSGFADLSYPATNNPVEVYEEISKILHFKKSEPDKLGTNSTLSVIVKSIKPSAGIGLLFTIIGWIPMLFVASIIIFSDLQTSYGGLIISIIFIVSILHSLFMYISFKKKQYDFYEDKLDYYDGFLTLNKATVPYERITDITLLRTLKDRIFGVSTITVETAGSQGAEIVILFVKNGESIVDELKEVLKKHGKN